MKFFGEYLKGEKNGNAIEYYENGQMKFDGRYSYGRKDYGREYDSNGNLIHEGEYYYYSGGGGSCC